MRAQANVRTILPLPLLFGTLLGLLVPLSAQSPASLPLDSPTHLRGTVVNSVTHEPVPHALVYSPDNRFATTTSDDGRFEFTLPQGLAVSAKHQFASGSDIFFTPTGLAAQPGPNRPNSLIARKPGYLENYEGQGQVSIEPNQEEVTIPLLPEARVIGQVVPPGTDGAQGIRVALYQRFNQDGRERWEAVGGEGMTRTGGKFRFANLAPGSYKLLTHESMDRDP